MEEEWKTLYLEATEKCNDENKAFQKEFRRAEDLQKENNQLKMVVETMEWFETDESGKDRCLVCCLVFLAQMIEDRNKVILTRDSLQDALKEAMASARQWMDQYEELMQERGSLKAKPGVLPPLDWDE